MSILWRHFPRQKPLKSKNKKKTYDCLEHKVLPSFKLKRIKTAKIVPKWPPQGSHSHILMTGGSEGFFGVWHLGQKGFFLGLWKTPGFFWVAKTTEGFFWVLYFSSVEIKNNISAIYSFVFDQNQSWSWHVLAFQKMNNKICWRKNTEGFLWVC